MAKRAFTLVELLVVIVIIGLLMGLLLPAVNGVRRSARKAAAAIEISQLDFALKSLKEKYGEYPPDFADVDREAAMRQVRRFIAKVWPRCTRLPRDFRGTELPSQFNAGTALVFWLGGNYDRTQDLATGRWIIQHVGFSADPTNPFDVDAAGDPLPATAPPGDPARSASRVNRFFPFPNDRLTGSPVANFAFWPKTYFQPTSGAGYVYFRAESKSYGLQTYTKPSGEVVVISGGKGFPTLAYGAIVDGRVSTPVLSWLNTDSYQIRSCGPDGMWYAGPSGWGMRLGLSEGFTVPADDMGNCWEGSLEDTF